jgi:hypothetical protein
VEITENSEMFRACSKRKLNAKKRLEKLEAQRRRLIDVFQEGFIFREEFEERMASLSKRIEEMKSDLIALEVEYKNADTDGNRKTLFNTINNHQ